MLCMSITRRSLLVGGAALASAAHAKAFYQAGGGLTAGDVVERIKGKVGMPWMTQTVDRIVAGSADVRVKGIATTMMATLEVIERAVAAGKNMIVTHEPTFYSHQDTTNELEKDPTYEFKQRFLAEHQVAVFRFHDHWHRMKPDGINMGMTRELGWEKNATAEDSHEFVFEATAAGRVCAGDGLAAEGAFDARGGRCEDSGEASVCNLGISGPDAECDQSGVAAGH